MNIIKKNRGKVIGLVGTIQEEKLLKKQILKHIKILLMMI